MQLRVARLCLDCEEIHADRTCPRCTSESFALISRWVPAPERRARPRPESTEADTYRALLAAEAAERRPASHPWLKGGAMLATIGLGSWLLGRRRDKPRSE